MKSLTIGSHTFHWGARTYVMGILNVTPDSFSGDGILDKGDVVAAAITQAQEFLASGADILDVGGESTRPGSQPVDTQAELERVEFKRPRATVYSNVTAQPHTDPQSIKKLLVDQIVKPVRWEQTMQRIAPVEGARFVELAPGRVLTGLLKKINRRLPVETLSTADALTATKPA